MTALSTALTCDDIDVTLAGDGIGESFVGRWATTLMIASASSGIDDYLGGWWH